MAKVPTKFYKEKSLDKVIFDDTKPIDNGEPVVVNKSGGMSSKITAAYHLIPYRVMQALSKVYHYGAYIRPYGPWNWRKVDSWDHYNHLQTHLQNWRQAKAKFVKLDADNVDDPEYAALIDFMQDELEHALCRMSMLYSKEMGVDDELVDVRDA